MAGCPDVIPYASAPRKPANLCVSKQGRLLLPKGAALEGRGERGRGARTSECCGQRSGRQEDAAAETELSPAVEEAQQVRYTGAKAGLGHGEKPSAYHHPAPVEGRSL